MHTEAPQAEHREGERTIPFLNELISLLRYTESAYIPLPGEKEDAPAKLEQNMQHIERALEDEKTRQQYTPFFVTEIRNLI